MVGCASHRFNLAVTEYLAKYSNIWQKLNLLMRKLKNLKLSAKLRRFTDKRLLQMNATRWSSKYAMIHRYNDSRLILETHFARESTLVDSFLTVRDNQDIHAVPGNF